MKNIPLQIISFVALEIFNKSLDFMQLPLNTFVVHQSMIPLGIQQNFVKFFKCSRQRADLFFVCSRHAYSTMFICLY
jgi:hypothetical protein